MHKNDTRLFSPWDIPLALVLLTRLPLPALPQPVFRRQARAVWAFPVAGLAVGGAACLIGWGLMALGLPPLACAALLVATSTILTGAMHEDGLADTADGLWGGFTIERRLDIMKDSHIGTYGVLALILSQLLRVTAIAAVISGGTLAGVISAAVVSRGLMPFLMRWLPNARGAGLSHSVGKPPAAAVVGGANLAVILGALFAGWSIVIPMACAAVAAAVIALIARSKIGGQTGDILGAAQQISEVVFLLALAAA
ncbi:cobalamin 5'-phosphate synthase [Ruegeria lacuscaerulensis ITI-1157]|nr:cobalamin 5'-phosphate synthase [Ruegeria lacuscaerulensis ITI-1157]SHI57736.1 cobalamin-5'-phosphate synthase [Ruegeria lacuscaerulensis ITI-1157]